MTGPRFDSPAGLITPGNVDLTNRPRVKNPDGSISTVRSMSFNQDGKEILVPTVSEDGRIMTNDEAVKQYQTTGKHLGIFKDPASATDYAQRLHQDQAKTLTGDRAKPKTVLDDPRMAALFGLQPGSAPAVPHPAPTDTIAAFNAINQRREKGGAGGGEFSDPEMADYNRAAGNVDNAISAERLAPMIAALKAKAAQKPDATATRRSK